MTKVEQIACPYCQHHKSSIWAEENGYTAVRCNECGFIFVNPRPVADLISDAVETGIHKTLGGHNVIGRRVASKVDWFRALVSRTHPDLWAAKQPISWLDIGSGFGEVVEAVQSLAPQGSRIVGVEPMKPKAEQAKARGLNTINGYLGDVPGTFQFASLINVCSHIPDFRAFVVELKTKLDDRGEFFLVAGNTGDLERVTQLPSELDMPDHLTFAGRKHLVGFLEEAGFEIVSIDETRRDNLSTLIKNTIKTLMGRKAYIVFPGTSPYRDLAIRARLKSAP
ncbi:methyltransferase domain-containing protein [Myxococcota bacterium]|nr:methyltransferase domain-containing protein [Myxococcota bacterium]